MQDLVGFDVVQALDNAAWPFHRYLINPAMFCQTKMKPLVVLGNTVHPPCLFTYLDDITYREFNSGANAVPVGHHPFQIYFQPVVVISLVTK